MIQDETTLPQHKTHTLWQKLTDELLDIFDAHGVCAAVAHQVAEFAGVTAIVGVSDPQERYFDIWICDPNGDIRQTRWDKKQAAFQPFFELGAAAIHEKFLQPATHVIGSELWQIPAAHILACPLPVKGRYIPLTPPGILCLIDAPADSPVNLENISALGTHITMALDRAYLRQHVDRQEIEFTVVSEISYALTATLSLQNIYLQLMEPVRRTLNVGSISVGLIDPDTGEITFVDILMGELFRNLPVIRLQRGQGIAGWVADNREPAIINNVYEDSRFFPGIDRKSGFETESMICIPLQVEERVIGVLQAINKKNGRFNDNDLRLLQAIGGPLAAAIENASLHSEVLAEKQRIETIFTNMSEGMLTVNAAGIITHANESLLTLLLLDRQALIGKKANEIIQLTSSSLDEFTERILAVDEEYPQIATELQQKGQEPIPVLISGAPIRNEEKEVRELIFVFSDLSQVREVERMRDNFFHNIIHELRTPLATILMYARLLREGKAPKKEKADRFLGVIERESDRLQKMVRQMLELAKMESNEFQRSQEPVFPNPIFDEMLPAMADRATANGLIFRQKIAPDLPPVLGNRETLYMIFKNLIDNAIKFTLSGAVRIEIWAEGDQLIFKVADDGIGIPKQAFPNLFGRFFRAQTAVERGIAGTGLGLYMVKEAVENYNGTIELESAAGAGTTVTVMLPTTTNI